MIDIDQANQTVVQRMMAARPILTSIARARDVVPGMRENLLLHAGPPIPWERMSGPLRGAVIGALIFEGLAGDEAGAVALVERGRWTSSPAIITRRSARWLASPRPRCRSGPSRIPSTGTAPFPT